MKMKMRVFVKIVKYSSTNDTIGKVSVNLNNFFMGNFKGAMIMPHHKKIWVNIKRGSSKLKKGKEGQIYKRQKRLVWFNYYYFFLL